MADPARTGSPSSTRSRRDWIPRGSTAWTVALVALHYLANLAHGGVHALVPVALAPWQTAFVVLFVGVLPAAGVAGPTVGRDRVGWALAGVSLLLSAGFGIYHHFLVANPDNVAAVAGPFGGSFAATAVAIAVVDVAGGVACLAEAARR